MYILLLYFYRKCRSQSEAGPSPLPDTACDSGRGGRGEESKRRHKILHRWEGSQVTVSMYFIFYTAQQCFIFLFLIFNYLVMVVLILRCVFSLPLFNLEVYNFCLVIFPSIQTNYVLFTMKDTNFIFQVYII